MAYFYLKGGGTAGATTDDGRETVLRTGTWNASSGDYYDTLADVLNAGKPNAPTAGDFILWSDASTDTFSSHQDHVIPAGVTLLTVSNSNQDQYSAASSALVTTTGAFRFSLVGPSVLGRNALTMGVNAQMGDGIGSSVAYGGILNTHIMHDVSLDQNSNSAESHNLSGQYGGSVLMHSPTISNATNENWVLTNAYAGACLILGGSVSDTSDFLKAGNRGGKIVAVGVDMSGMPASSTIATIDNARSIGEFYLYRCELPPNWAVSNFTQTTTSSIIIESCDSEYQYEQIGYFGDVSFVTSRYHDDDPALSDGSSKGSYHFQPNTSVSKMGPLFLSNPVMPRWLMAENTEASTKPKVRLKFATATTDTLDTASIWVYVMYPDSTNTYVWKTVRHQVSPIESGSALSTQTSKWVGSGTDNQYYLDVTMTSPGNGLVACMVGFTEDKDVFLSPVIEFVA